MADATLYAQDAPAQGLLFTDNDALVAPRIALFLDSGIGERVLVHVQLDADTRFDPNQENRDLRFDEYFVEAHLTERTGRLTLRLGKFATVFGSWIVAPPRVGRPDDHRAADLRGRAADHRSNGAGERRGVRGAAQRPSTNSSTGCRSCGAPATRRARRCRRAPRRSTRRSKSRTRRSRRARRRGTSFRAVAIPTRTSPRGCAGTPSKSGGSAARSVAGRICSRARSRCWVPATASTTSIRRRGASMPRTSIAVCRSGANSCRRSSTCRASATWTRLSGFVEARFKVVPQIWLGARWNQSWFDDVHGATYRGTATCEGSTWRSVIDTLRTSK